MNPLIDYVPSNYSNAELMNAMRDHLPPATRERLESWADAADVVDASHDEDEYQVEVDRADDAERKLGAVLELLADIRRAWGEVEVEGDVGKETPSGRVESALAECEKYEV